MSQLISPIETDDGIENRLERIRANRIAAVNERALRWLVLLPEWTDSLAKACDFPGGDEELHRAHRAQLCEARLAESYGSPPTYRFAMQRSMRSWLLEFWQREGNVRLEQDIVEIAHRVITARGDGSQVSIGIQRWSELAIDELSEKVVTGDTLLHRVRQCIGQGKVSNAFDWIFAGEALSQALGARMQLASSRARRQVNLLYRRAQDERYLERFIRREEQVAEIERLLGSDSEWALHFIGPGGMGKTMLMRFITSQLEDNPIASASRVDFDYIDPRLPLENPARLLQELGEGLAVDLPESAQEALYRSFLEAVTEAEAARSGTDPRLVRPQNLPEFERAIAAFARFLRSLEPPVALVLDTCEELAKLHPPGRKMESISATFRILHRLHESAGHLKVIVAGRRWLTWKYANESREGDAVPQSVREMEPFEFMRMHDVRGFTEAEMLDYLERRVPGLELGEEMRAAIRENAFDEASAPATAFSRPRDHQDRYSPNDVALIGDWLQHDSDLDPKALIEGNFDPYVEARIVERMEGDPELLAALPLVMLLERFDGATIEPLLGEDPTTRRRVLAGLIDEDWTHLEGGPEPEDIVIKVDPGLLPRLQAYYGGTEARREVRDKARERLTEHLLNLLERPPGSASIEGIGAALRIAPLGEAVSGFDRLAARVAREPAWEWAEGLCERLLSPDREPPLDHSLRPSVWTLYLTALKHRETTVNLRSFWAAIEAISNSHPDPIQATILATRGRLGALVAAVESEDYDGWGMTPALSRGRLVLDQLMEEVEGGEPGEQEALPPSINDTVAPALLAAVEALIDAHEERGVSIPFEAIDVCLSRLREAFAGEVLLQAYVLALGGRAHALAGNSRAAHASFARLGRMQLPRTSDEPRFADWVAPASIAHRVMLELLRFRLREGSESDQLLERCEQFVHARYGGNDAAQLLSLVIQVRLADGSVTREQLEQAQALEGVVEGYRLTAPVHRCAPPLFVSLAEGWLAVGLARRALELLTERERQATARRTDEHVTRAAALALMRVLRRLRLRERLALISHSTVGDDDLRGEALAAGALIVGLQPMLKRPIERDHAAWRTRILLDDADPDLAPVRPAVEESPSRHDPNVVHAALDRLESEMVFQRLRGVPDRLVHSDEAFRAMEQCRVAPSLIDPLGVEATRLRLRAEALIDDPPVGPHPLGRPRQEAELALEEGELLALRVPERATVLLHAAEQGFDEVGDAYSAFVASLLGAIAEIHAGRELSARERKQSILFRYERLREGDLSLPPPWSLGSEGQPEKEIDPIDPWRAWVWRLSYYLVWCDGFAESADFEQTSMEFGPEFSLVPARGAVRRSLAPKTRARTKDFVRMASAVRWLPVALALLFLLVLGLSTDVWAIAGLAAGVAVLPAAIELIGPRLSRRVLPIGGFEILLLAPPRSMRMNSEVAAAWIRVSPWARAKLMRLYLGFLHRHRPPAWGVLPLGTDAGAAIEQRLPTLEQALRPLLWGGYPSLQLHIDSDLAQISWERRLTADLVRTPGWSPSCSPPIWRIRPSEFSLLPDWPQGISVVSARGWRQFMESAASSEVRWVEDFDFVGGPTRPQVLDSPVSRKTREGARAVVSLGLPVVTRAGWRLRLDDEELSAAGEERFEPRTQHLISPDLLVREAPILVIVGRPDGLTLTPDKRVSDGLRALAHEAFLAGAQAVITVPVLPPRHTAAALELLVSEIRDWRRPPDASSLVELVTELQTQIYEAGPSDSEEEQAQRVELALDVCLFAPREVSRK